MSGPVEGHQVVERRWNYGTAVMAHVRRLTDELDQWLEQLTNETRPHVAEAGRPTVVVFRPWVDSLIDTMEIQIIGGKAGSAWRIVTVASVPTLSDQQQPWTRYRLGTIFGAALREWVDEPHY